MSKTSRYAQVASMQGTRRSNATVLPRNGTLGTHVSVQREAANHGVQPGAASLVREVVESPGRPLDATTRSLMEPRFGYDFSRVRAHTDERAATSAEAVRANAYTAGDHVVFGAGRYAPGTPGGQRLMTHELTHVVQQASGPVSGTPVGESLSISHPGDQFERQAAANANHLNGHRESMASVPVREAQVPDHNNEIHVQRDDADVSAGAGVASAVAGGISAIFAGVALIPAFESAKAAKEQAKEAHEQTELSRENLAVAKDQLAVAENPPAPAPTTGGIVVNNNNPYADIPDSDPKDTKGEPKEVPLTLLKVSQGAKDFATFNAVIQSNGKNIKGGYLQDGPAQGYLGGSAAANLNLTLKPMLGPRTDFTPPKGRKTTVGSVRFLMSGNNIAPRTKTGTQIQRFSGALTVTAASEVIVSNSFSANPGTKTSGDGVAAPAISIDLPATAPAGGIVPAPAAEQTPAKSAGSPAGGTPPK